MGEHQGQNLMDGESADPSSVELASNIEETGHDVAIATDESTPLQPIEDADRAYAVAKASEQERGELAQEEAKREMGILQGSRAAMHKYDTEEGQQAILQEVAEKLDEYGRRFPDTPVADLIQENGGIRPEDANAFLHGRVRLEHGSRYEDRNDVERKVQGLEQRANNLEYWADRIHDHPEAAGDWSPQDCINIVRWIEAHSGEAPLLREHIERLQEQDREGQLTAFSAGAEHAALFGTQSERGREWRDLGAANSTTVEMIKERLLQDIGTVANEWDNEINRLQAKLHAIQGEPKEA